MRRALKLAALTASLLLCWATAASATTLHLLGDFDKPIFVTSNPADPNQLLVVEREGRVMLVDGAGVRVYANLEPLVSCCEGERGLLSIAPAPDFASSGRFFADYTGTPAAGGAEGDLHVDAFSPAPEGGGAALREPLFSVGHSQFSNHNGGQLEIGPDGYLYVSAGDGGGGGDPLGSGQDLGSLLGKILRVEARPGAEPEIWSYGLRNPWRFSFDRASGAMVIGDVGQDEREEVDLAASPGPGLVGGHGANYGWNCREGFIPYSGAPESCEGAGGFTDPVFDYPHADPGDGSAHGCAITGGYVVRDASLPGLYGRYLYSDYCTGEIRSLVLPSGAGGLASDDRSEGLTVPEPVSFGEDSCGRLYVASQAGAVYRLEGPAPASCSQATPTAAIPGTASVPRRRAAENRVRVRLRAAIRRLGGEAELTLTARVSPCGGRAGSRLQLNRGGRRLATKRLDRRCVARFRLRIAHRSTFRALLPSGGYRSQVRTIALAKPRP